MIEFLEKLIHEFQLPLHNPILAFSLILIIILLSPILLRKLNIPGIIGLIISGVIVGPHGLNILAQNSAVTWFSTIGLLYIMFIAGLELDLSEFKANKNKSLSFGAFTFIIPLAIGYPIVHFGLGYDFNAAFLTASMFATHTLVAYPIVSNMGISKNQAVAITVGGTIFTDTAVLIILAIIVANSQGSLNAEFWIRMGVSFAIFLAIVFLVIPRIAQWFFKKLENERHSHYIFVLSVVFFCAFLAEVAGIESIIGAFGAGLALNSLIPHSSALMNRIEFIGNSLFIPFFLISVGMLVDVRVIMSGVNAWIIAGALTIVAIGGKWIAAWVTQHVFKYSSGQRGLIFGLSGAHAAATLAVILVGHDRGIIDDNILNGTVILILIASVVATFATEKAAKKVLAETRELNPGDIDSNNAGINEHLLIPVANIDNMGKLLEFSVLIKNKNSKNPVSVLSVVENDSEAESKIAKARGELQTLVKQGAATETGVSIIATIDYEVASGISRVSKEILADAVIMMWPRKNSISDRLEEILSKVNKTIFVADFKHPLGVHKRTVLIAPPYSELEDGFEFWYSKVAKFSQEMSATIELYANKITSGEIEKFHKKSKFTAPIHPHEFDDWEDILIISRDIKENDMLIVASSRKNGISHQFVFDTLPAKLQKYFESSSKVIVYPQQEIQLYDAIDYEAPVEPLTRGLETIHRVSKGLGNIFKKKE